MFWELFRFELYYRRRRATTYVYFLVILVSSAFVVLGPTFQVSGAADVTSPNSPYTIGALMVVLSFFFTMITSSLVGVAVIRDVEHEMAPIIFTTPIHKGSYLFGRFAGSLVTLIFLNTGIIFGALLAYTIGKATSLDITWRAKEVLPFNAWSYIQPFLIFTVSNVFITGSLFFASGALGRRPMVIYSQGIVLMMIYQVAAIVYLRDLDSQFIAALVDPFGVQTFVYMTRYWTPAQQNTLLVPFTGALLYNRIIWMSIAVIALVVTYRRFSFTTRRKKNIAVEEGGTVTDIPTIEVSLPLKQKSVFRQLVSTTLFHYRGIWKEIPFWAIAGAGFLVLLVNASRLGRMLGTSSYPTTSTVIAMLNSFALFFTIIAVFYSGEMVWKERQFKINAFTDATPIRNGVLMLSKFLSLCLVYLSLLSGFFVFGILLQASHGYFYFDLPAYFGKMLEAFLNLALLTVAAMLIQVLAGNKILGFMLTIAFVIIIQVLPMFGVVHEMAAYGSGTLESFSQMNGFGHFVTPFIWLKAYWISLAVVFFVVAIQFYRRGTTRQSLAFGTTITGTVAMILFAISGVYIYYNTSIVNRRVSLNEKEVGSLTSSPQPKIVEVNLSVDLYPERRSFEAKGSYWLKNSGTEPVDNIIVRYMNSSNIDLHDITFERESKINGSPSEPGYNVYEITPALAPGDSLRMSFAMDFTQNGFKSKPQNTDLAYNGTFIRSSYFPAIGYESKTADRIRFAATMSTDNPQVPIASGHLEKSWTSNNRQYRQYKATGTMLSSYAMFSGNYATARDKWNDIDLEIYYHPAHSFNIARMMQGLKDGLDYYTKNFGPYRDAQVRLVEVPKYTTLAESFPGIIAFPEGAGFILKVSDPAKDLDVPYFATTHELAHQWWGQHVIAADTAGQAMLTEGMAQYSSLMVLQHSLPVETVELFLKYELDSYLKGRAAEKKRELPLQSASDQKYITDNKSALIFFALQDYIGEDSLNAAFRRFHDKFAYKKTHAISKDLIAEIRKVTPDTLSYLISDMFEHITLYENQTTEAAYRKLPTGKYEVTMNISARKLQVDTKGIEADVVMNDWLDVGVFGQDEHGKPKLIYLQKHKFTRQKNTLTVSVNSQPLRVGIDPLHKCVDRHPKDNTVTVGTVVELANSPLGY